MDNQTTITHSTDVDANVRALRLVAQVLLIIELICILVRNFAPLFKPEWLWSEGADTYFMYWIYPILTLETIVYLTAACIASSRFNCFFAIWLALSGWWYSPLMQKLIGDLVFIPLSLNFITIVFWCIFLANNKLDGKTRAWLILPPTFTALYLVIALTQFDFLSDILPFLSFFYFICTIFTTILWFTAIYKMISSPAYAGKSNAAPTFTWMPQPRALAATFIPAALLLGLFFTYINL